MVSASGMIARSVALNFLESVLSGGNPLDQTIAKSKTLSNMSASDRGFARLLVGTTLRRLGEIDLTLARHLRKPLPQGASTVLHVLRLGAAQLIFLDTPPHAAVDTSVRLAKSSKFDGFVGLVNAVLRRVAGTSPLSGAQAGRINTPPWLWKSWTEAYGESTAADIAVAQLREAPLDLTERQTGAVDAAEINAVRLPTGSLRCANPGNPADIKGFSEGNFWIQDAAAALPARLIPEPRAQRIIDLCAAPGGKSAQLAAAGAMVTAVERSPARVHRLEENLKRLRLQVETVAADALVWRPDEPADAVLLDAPCTATGTIRRHPDVPHLKRPEDPARLAEIQKRLIDAAAEMVRPGGVLVYAVCSLQPDEGPMVIDSFLKRNGAFSRFAVGAGELPGIDGFTTSTGDLRTLPCHWPETGGLDGFYAARLKRC